jgi:hypothetical protein
MSLKVPPCALLAATVLAAQGPSSPWEGRVPLGSDPLEQIRLTPPGCWKGLVLAAPPPSVGPRGRATPGATVEVWDFTFQESPRSRNFALFLRDFRSSLLQALESPPPSYGAIELGEFMASDPSQPQRLDLTRVQSLQDRYNRPPGRR